LTGEWETIQVTQAMKSDFYGCLGLDSYFGLHPNLNTAQTRFEGLIGSFRAGSWVARLTPCWRK